MKKRLLSIALTLIMLLTIVPTNIFNFTVSAAQATTVTLTDSMGTQIILYEDVSTATYSYVAETATLTLNEWTGRKISANGDFNLHLIGTNNIIMVDGSDQRAYGIEGDVTITAQSGGVLNITDGGTALTKGFCGINDDVTHLSIPERPCFFLL